VSTLEDRLRSALRIALRERNAVAMGALRSTLAALANATAVQSVPLAPGADEHVAGSVSGLGAAEVPRRELTDDEAVAIVRMEIADRIAAAEQYGRSPAADRLRSEAALLSRFID
jgi:uncharacterized protein YqeY